RSLPSDPHVWSLLPASGVAALLPPPPLPPAGLLRHRLPTLIVPHVPIRLASIVASAVAGLAVLATAGLSVAYYLHGSPEVTARPRTPREVPVITPTVEPRHLVHPDAMLELPEPLPAMSTTEPVVGPPLEVVEPPPSISPAPPPELRRRRS